MLTFHVISIIIASIAPIVAYLYVGSSPSSKASDQNDYFIYGQEVSVEDYANASVGYALQMAALFLFAYWGVIYGLGALWVPIFWALGYLLLYFWLPHFLRYHATAKSKSTMHEFLADQFGGGRLLQTIAAVATILGLLGTMLAEVDFVSQIFAPVIERPVLQFLVRLGFLGFGVIYVLINGYKAEVNTERWQVPFAYSGILVVVILLLPSVELYSGWRSYFIVTCLVGAILFLMILAQAVQGWSWKAPVKDKQILIPIIALAALILVTFWTLRIGSSGSQAMATTILDQPLRIQFRARGRVALVSLFIANVLWMPIDLSTWQRVASVRGVGDQVLPNLRRGTLRVMLESPATWLLGICLGLVIACSGTIREGNDPSNALPTLAIALYNGSIAPYLSHAAPLLYPIFVAACVAVMLSTVGSLISAISFTAYRDLPPYSHNSWRTSARYWGAGIVILGVVLYELARAVAGNDLSAFLYSAYSAQLSLFPIVLFAFMGKRLSWRAAVISVATGLTAALITFVLAARDPANPSIAVLPPIFSVGFAFFGYFLGYRKPNANRGDKLAT